MDNKGNTNLIIYCDGGSRGNPGLAASAFIIFDKDFKELVGVGKYLGIATNNVAEYTAVLEALNWLLKNKDTNNKIFFYLDSQLVVNQLNGVFKIKDSNLLSLATKIKLQEKLFTTKIIYQYIPREKNKKADLLVNKTLDRNIFPET